MKTIRTTCSMLVPIVADYGAVIEGVPDELACQLARMGNAVILGGRDDPEPAADALKRLSDEWAPVMAAGPEPREPAEPAIEEAKAIEEAEAPGELKRPYGNAAKAAWIRWALYSDPDLTQEAASEMSKVQLMTAYGERL